SRSQAIVDMINRHLIDDLVIRDEVMVGTLTLLYDVSLKPLRSQLVDLQQQYLAQVINSLHIQLDDEKILQVMLMQGASSDLKEISEQFIALKGVIKGHLELMDAVMPPIPQNTEHTEREQLCTTDGLYRTRNTPTRITLSSLVT